MTTATEDRIHGLRSGAVAARAAASHLRKAGAEALAQQAQDIADATAALLREYDTNRDDEITQRVTLPAPEE